MADLAERFTVTTEEAGLRLDALLKKRFPNVTRRILKDLFTYGRVTLGGHRVPKGHVAPLGGLVEVKLPPDDRAHPNPELDVNVVTETEDWVIVEKPAGMPSVAQSGEDLTSMANALVARYPEMQTLGYHPREAGLVHRLDTFTSGLLLAARHPAAFSTLASALRQGLLSKEYLGVTEPPLESEGQVTAQLVPGGTRVKVAPAAHTVSAKPKDHHLPTTQYRVLRRVGPLVLVEFQAPAARRHQIRAHMASIGCPLYGDTLYGSPHVHPSVPRRHALHASRIQFSGSPALPGFDVQSPLPPDLELLLNLPNPSSG